MSMVETLAETYDAQFYAAQADASYRSAAVVTPHIVELFAPMSVVDVGCGVGTWLRAFAECGVTQLLGLDGPHVDPVALRIPAAQFRAHDLRTPLPEVGRFDLALSLEVAEHLPDECADGLVAALTRLAPIVVFSAAIPGQGGTSHVNEQWPDYWAALFRRHQFEQLDVLRPLIWQDERIEWWYRQNIFVYMACELLSTNESFRAMQSAGSGERLTVVRESYLRYNVDLEKRLGLRAVLAMLPRLIARRFGSGKRK